VSVAGNSHQMTTAHEATKSLLPRTAGVRRTTSYGYVKLSMGSVDPWVGLRRVGSRFFSFWGLGWVYYSNSTKSFKGLC